MEYEPVIGLEVHLQLKTATKLFCGCPTTFGATANSQTCPVCLGLPGVLPVLNERTVEFGLRVALALECRIASVMKFDRKQYFYPDLPKNYQISQYDKPLAQEGFIEFLFEEQLKRVRIRRAHLEEDAGKLLHETGQTASFVDFNRTGIPLLEIVSEPDLFSADEAYQYLVELKAILQSLDVSTCNMEEGSLRCDTNISLRPAGSKELGSKVEIKNLNSFRAVRLSLKYEIQRQASILDRKERIPQETRLWDAQRQVTESMRSKEEAADYRYFPEPDLVPFVLEESFIQRVRSKLPELPKQRSERLQKTYQLSAYDARVLTQQRALADLFENAIRAGAAPKPAANWILGDLSAYLNAKALEAEKINLRPEWLVHLLQLMADGTISGKIAKEVFLKSLEQGMDPLQIVKESGVRQIVDSSLLEQLADAVLQDNPQSIEDYRCGKVNSLTHLMGQAMKRSQGKANPPQIMEILKRKLEGQNKA